MPEQHPIEGLMKTTMENIKQMTDVNTVIGDAVESPDGSVIIPICKVCCGFGTGGGEFEQAAEGGNEAQGQEQIPLFGGGSGAGVSVKPLGFLVVGNGQLRLLPVDNNVTIDRIIDLAPQVISQIKSMFNKNKDQNETVDNAPQSTYSPPANTTPPPPQTPPPQS